MIILASSSRYRMEYMSAIVGPTKFIVVPSKIYDERAHEEDTQDPVILARRHALGKAREVATIHPTHIVIGFDQTLEVGGNLLHKVKTEEEAVQVLRTLRGQDLTICTGVALLRPCMPEIVRSETTFVKVRPDLSDHILQNYVRTYLPMDCLGCFRVNQVPYFFVNLPPDPSNVQGFPRRLVREMLEPDGVIIGT